jgi:hypothetical protein
MSFILLKCCLEHGRGLFKKGVLVSETSEQGELRRKITPLAVQAGARENSHRPDSGCGRMGNGLKNFADKTPGEFKRLHLCGNGGADFAVLGQRQGVDVSRRAHFCQYVASNFLK